MGVLCRCLRGFVFSVTAGHLAHGLAMEQKLDCESFWDAQFESYFVMAKTVEEACIKQNERLERSGKPSCGSFCTQSFVRVIDRGSFKLDVEFSNETGSSFGGSFPSLLNSDDIKVTLKLSLTVPLGPTDTLQCINPMFSPVVEKLGQKLLETPWIEEAYQSACLGVS